MVEGSCDYTPRCFMEAVVTCNKRANMQMLSWLKIHLMQMQPCLMIAADAREPAAQVVLRIVPT